MPAGPRAGEFVCSIASVGPLTRVPRPPSNLHSAAGQHTLDERRGPRAAGIESRRPSADQSDPRLALARFGRIKLHKRSEGPVSCQPAFESRCRHAKPGGAREGLPAMEVASASRQLERSLIRGDRSQRMDAFCPAWASARSIRRAGFGFSSVLWLRAAASAAASWGSSLGRPAAPWPALITGFTRSCCLADVSRRMFAIKHLSQQGAHGSVVGRLAESTRDRFGVQPGLLGSGCRSPAASRDGHPRGGAVGDDQAGSLLTLFATCCAGG